MWLNYQIHQRKKYKSRKMVYYRVIESIENYKNDLQDGITYKFGTYGVLVCTEEYKEGKLINKVFQNNAENKE